MDIGRLEHANVTVSDLDRTAKMLCDVFGWHIRWRGDSKMSGLSVHVGNEDTYLALYRQEPNGRTGEDTYSTVGGLNHLAVVVEDIEATKARVVAAGYEPGEHYDYEPGERFYFDDHDGIEFEVVSYA